MEELETEKAIDPLNNPQQESRLKIKQEEREEQLHEVPEQTSSGNASDNKTEESKGSGEERGALEEDDERGQDQEEESRVNEGAMDGPSESTTPQE